MNSDLLAWLLFLGLSALFCAVPSVIRLLRNWWLDQVLMADARKEYGRLRDTRSRVAFSHQPDEENGNTPRLRVSHRPLWRDESLLGGTAKANQRR